MQNKNKKKRIRKRKDIISQKEMLIALKIIIS